MLFSRLPLTLLTLTFAFAVDTIFAEGDNESGHNSGVKYVDIFAVNYPIVAYVVDSYKDTTTYHIACSSDIHTTSCPFVQPYTLIQGPSTISFEFTQPITTTTASASLPQLTQSFTLGCKLDSTTSMGCSATGLAEEADSPVTTSQTFSFTGTAAQAFFKEVQVVTKTEDLLTHTPGVTSKSAKATITGGVFFEGKQAAVASPSPTIGVAESVSLANGILIAEAATGSPTATGKSSSGVQTRVGDGVFYSGLVVAGLLSLGML